MKSITAIRNSVVALALGVGSSMMPASTLLAEPAPPRSTIEVTTQDVAASNAKVQAAYDALVTMWSADFKQIGERFDAPEIMRYRSTNRCRRHRTENDACLRAGDMRHGNADGGELHRLATAVLDVDLAGAAGGQVLRVFANLADGFHAVVGSAVDLDHVHAAAGCDLFAARACVARVVRE